MIKWLKRSSENFFPNCRYRNRESLRLLSFSYFASASRWRPELPTDNIFCPTPEIFIRINVNNDASLYFFIGTFACPENLLRAWHLPVGAVCFMQTQAWSSDWHLTPTIFSSHTVLCRATKKKNKKKTAKAPFSEGDGRNTSDLFLMKKLWPILDGARKKK